VSFFPNGGALPIANAIRGSMPYANSHQFSVGGHGRQYRRSIGDTPVVHSFEDSANADHWYKSEL